MGLRSSSSPRPAVQCWFLPLLLDVVLLLLFLLLFTERATELVEDKGSACERACMLVRMKSLNDWNTGG